MDPELPIRSLDYTVIYVRQMEAMRAFYGATMGFPLHRELSPRWIEYRIGSNTLALAERGGRFDDPAPPVGELSLQLAFRVAPQEVDLCAATLAKRGVTIVSPPTDQPFGHRTLFFRDPDGNVLEISPRSIRHDEGMAYRVLGRLSGKDRPEHIIARDPRITHLSAFAGRHFAGRA